MKIKDICKISTKSVTPKKDVAYHLYSLPAFDANKEREEILGCNIHSNKLLVPDKCILFNKLNVRFKRVWCIDNSDKNKLASTEFLPLIIDENRVDFQYCYYLLISDAITNYLCGQNSNTSGSHKRIDPTDFLNIEITLPLMIEQQKIGKILADIDSKIDLNRQINQNLEALAKQLYDYWFVQFDFPDENSKPYKSSGGKMVWNEQLKRDIPEKWNAIKLGAFIKLDDSKRIPLSTYEREKRKGVYPYYGATGIMDYIDDYLFDDELILLAEDGSTSDSKGFPIVQYVWGKVWVNNHAHIIYPRNLSHKVYTYIMLKTIPVKLIETGSIQKKINQDNLLSYNIIDVPTSILDEFTKIVTPIWKKKMIVDEEINALIKQRDELLPLLMNGQVNSDLSAD